MKFNTNLPPAECLKRLRNPVGSSPDDIREMISTKYSDYLNDSQVGYLKGKRICTSVNKNYYDVFVRRWCEGHFDDSSDNVRISFVGRIEESRTGGSTVVCWPQENKQLSMLYRWGWFFIVPPLALIGHYTKPELWLSTFGCLIATFAFCRAALELHKLPLEFIKDLLEVDKIPKKEECNHPAPTASESVTTGVLPSNCILAGMMGFKQLITALPVSECLERINSPTEFDPIHKSNSIKKEYKSYLWSEKQVIRGKCINTKVDGCNFEIYIKAWGINSHTNRYTEKTTYQPYETIQAHLTGRMYENANVGSIIEYHFQFSDNELGYSVLFCAALIMFWVLWYVDGYPKPVLWITTIGIISVFAIYKLLNSRRVLSRFLKDLLDVKDTKKSKASVIARLRKSPREIKSK
jgi:hypothetical protein